MFIVRDICLLIIEKIGLFLVDMKKYMYFSKVRCLVLILDVCYMGVEMG